MQRREFLGLGAGAIADVWFGRFIRPFLFLDVEVEKTKNKEKLPEKIPIPPSLMLHSQHAKLENLNPLLDFLIQEGYSAITYTQWLESIATGFLFAKPILISCDDLTLVTGINNIYHFRKMKDAFTSRGMCATFAVVTEPVMVDAQQNSTVLRDQDSAKWDEICSWIADGMELATHSSHHTNLNDPDAKPNSSFTDADYEREIQQSVELIESELAKRGVVYKVKTFITPFGSGYDYKQTPSTIHPKVAEFCKKSGVKLVVGIAGGRTPIKTGLIHPQSKIVQYTGRVGPAESSSGLDPVKTLGYMNQWHATNERFKGS